MDFFLTLFSQSLFFLVFNVFLTLYFVTFLKCVKKYVKTSICVRTQFDLFLYRPNPCNP